MYSIQSYVPDSYSMVSPMKREDPLQQFETGRIKLLQEERLHIQKKTFTKWMNSFLAKARLEVHDLFTDLADGKILLKLLEIISGEKLGKANNGKMRVHKVENVNKSLAFLHTKVRLESIGAEDIVDGNPRLILGLIWTIILRFHIQEIEINLDEEDESSEKKSAKDALLLWCQRKTNGYRGVHIVDFTGSWKNGLGFGALIHAHRPDLIEYVRLDPKNHIENLNTAFQIAQDHLGIAQILDAEDVDTNKPDEKSIITYVASYYHTFARMRDEMKGSRRIANIMTQMKHVDNNKDRFDEMMSDLLAWIRQKIIELDDRTFPNSLDGIQMLLIEFKTYRTEEKPPKYMECSEIEALFFSINASLKSLNQPTFLPREGQMVKDIEKEWQKLEKAEHRREVALREELLRQEKLEHLAFKFEKKSVLRNGYLEEMIQVLSDPRYGSNFKQIDATIKKHEAISADILARKERFELLAKMVEELEQENYHSKDKVKRKHEDILNRWSSLLKLLEKHRDKLQQTSDLMNLLREANTILDSIKELALSFRSSDIGGFLLAVEDLIQKHSLMESQTKSIGETIKRFNNSAKMTISKAGKQKEALVIDKKMDGINKEYAALLDLSSQRRLKLEEARDFFLFEVDMEEEEAWVVEKQRICQAGLTAKDIRSVMSLQQKHKVLEDEIRARQFKTENVMKNGEKLFDGGHPNKASIKTEIAELRKNWKTLETLAADRRKLLEDATVAYSFIADANEVESWIKEKLPLVESNDFGEDEPSAQALLQLTNRLQGEIKAYDGDIKSLNDMGNKLTSKGIKSLNLTTKQTNNDVSEPDSSPYMNGKIIDDEPEEMEYVVEEKLLDMVKVRYPFDGQGMSMSKGDEMFLLNKTNNDWWNVRKLTGEEGFAPANYLRRIEPKLVKIRVKKPKQVQPKKSNFVRQRSFRDHSVVDGIAPDDTVEKRLNAVNTSCKDLKRLADLRIKLLKDSIKLFSFYRECTSFDQWMREKEKALKVNKAESVEVAKRKFEQLLTDLSAGSKRIEVIDKMVKELESTHHSQIDKVRLKHKQMHDQWNHLNRLKQQQEHNIEGASSVEVFNRICEETAEWMVEKMEKIDTDDFGSDLKTVQALQRKHDQLERELAPIEDKVVRVRNLGNSVKTSYPLEKDNVNKRQEEIQKLWSKLKATAVSRRKRLEEAVGSEIFLNSAKNLMNWVRSTQLALNSDETAKDVATAERLLESHNEQGDDIRNHEDEFKEVIHLGKNLARGNPNLVEIKEKLNELMEEQQAINQAWSEKGDWLRQCLDLQLFNREADHIDAATKAHNAFLDYTDLGSNLDDVEGLLKHHDNFENTLAAQDERLRTFGEMAAKLIEAEHYESEGIENRKNQVLADRVAVKNRSRDRREILAASMSFQQFKADADDFSSWMNDKKKSVEDESYKDLSNMERKMQKHEAFERELRSNEGQLWRLNKTGADLIGIKHYRSADIQNTLDDLKKQWDQLSTITQEKGWRLQQADDLLLYNRNLDEISQSLDSLQNYLKNPSVGTDLRSCKDLLTKHTNFESELLVVEKKITMSCRDGQTMVQYGHFDAENITRSNETFRKRFEHLLTPADKRKRALEEALRFHVFGFQVEAEVQWINDHLPLASSQNFGKSLHEAQSLHKKHQKFILELNGHNTQIDKTVNKGQQLINDNHPDSAQINGLCDEVTDAWINLNSVAERRTAELELNLKVQQYFFEASEVESWMNEKREILESNDFGKDEDAARKLLTKHKALELEIDSYGGLIKEMGNVGDKLSKTSHPESKLIKDRQQVIDKELVDLNKLSHKLRQKLMESMYRHEYVREADELESWIDEHMATASSEDYGQDYEHLVILQAKFDDFKLRVEAGLERFNSCDDVASKLIANENPFIQEIEEKRASLSKSWSKLLERTRVRDENLDAAGEIHRFNRDVTEALSRMQEKFKSIPDDLGKDVNSVQALIRKHEGFENDLVALEAQLQVLVDDAANLQSKYPGSNTEHIAEQQSLLIRNWDTLQENTLHRRNMLMKAEQLQKFLASSRDLLGWSTDLRSSMKTQEKVRDPASAQALKAEHERIKAEIEARESNFQNIFDKGKEMVEDEHYGVQEIQSRIEKVLEERSQLHAAWQNKKIYLDQLIDLQFFLRDVKQLESTCIAQEAALTSSDCGQTIEDVDSLVKKHLAFEKVFDAQEEKIELLKMHGSKLIEQNHFYSPNIHSHIDEVTERRDNVRNAARSRKQELENALLFAQFMHDISDASLWIDEKMTYLEGQQQSADITSFDVKVKKLQKHQAFMAEIQAHESRINAIIDKSMLLISKKHGSSSEINEKINDLKKRWKCLFNGANSHFKGLEDAQDILEFNIQVEKVETWMRDKEMLVQVGDLGEDYEHCLNLKRKLEDVDSDMRVDDGGFVKLNKLADKIIAKRANDQNKIQQQKEELNMKWRNLKGQIDKYHFDLTGALEVHKLSRDIDDTRDRINEKLTIVSSEDLGRDLHQVQSLQRKLEGISRDMSAIEKKIKEHSSIASVLLRKFPSKEPELNAKLKEVDDDWKLLCIAYANRDNSLASSCKLQTFQTDLKELRRWHEKIIADINSAPLPSNNEEAEAMLQKHHEKKVEIGGRKETIAKLKAFGQSLLEKNQNPDIIRESIEKIDQMTKEVDELWRSRQVLLTQAQELQVFLHMVKQVESGMSDKEAFLANDDLGDSLLDVEELIKKHSNFEKTLEIQDSKVNELETKANALIENGHYDENGIKQKLQAVILRRDAIKNSNKDLKEKLAESKSLQVYLRNVYEVQRWITEKLQIACDESYRDLANLQGKIQKHLAFEAEITANSERIAAVKQEGDDLLTEGHYAANVIEKSIEDLNASWEQLHANSVLKKQRLDQAYKALLLNRTLDDIDFWMDDMEAVLQSEDHGHDLISVHLLIQKHQRIEENIASHKSEIDQAKKSAQSFSKDGHFMSEEINNRVDNMFKRYESLQEPVQIRRENLNDSLLLHQLLRDLEEELQWIAEKEPIAASQDLGFSLSQVQKLQKKHKTLETEIQLHEPVINTIILRGQQMVRSGNFGSADIERKATELLGRLAGLKDMANVRKSRLVDAIESQMFYSDANDAELWMDEKRPLVESSDYGKDEDSVEVLLKKFEILSRDVDNFDSTINKLKAFRDKLKEKEHFDIDNVSLKMDNLEGEYDKIKVKRDKRRSGLEDSLKLYQFMRGCDAVLEWLADQMSIAASEDYGQDVEHVQVLTQKFDNFVSGLMASGDKIESIKYTADKLIQEEHKEEDKIKRKVSEVTQSWDDLKELSTARQEALSGAMQVHIFDRNAEETKSWIAEKMAFTVSEDYGHDLDAIHSLLIKHEGFERDLAAVKDQVESVVAESKRLSNLFPDAKDHIAVKYEETMKAWETLLELSAQRKDKLKQTEQLQAHFNEYRELMAWINEMIAKVTSPDLPEDVADAEAILAQHEDHKGEIDGRADSFKNYSTSARDLIKQGHFMSGEINEKLNTVESRHKLLLKYWLNRKEIYLRNLDLRIFMRDAQQIEKWIESRESVIHDDNFGESIREVEELIKNHDHFIKTIEAKEDALHLVKRLTKIEEMYKAQKEMEENARREEALRKEQERMNNLKMKEVQRITDARKREDERRRTQEIKIPKEDGETNISREDDWSSNDTRNMEEENGFGIVNGGKRGLRQELFRHSLQLNKPSPDVKRAESMMDPKKPKRVPSFTTRRRTQSFRKHKKIENLDNLPPVEIQGYLERKQEFQTGGKKATIRSWKLLYTVLCGQLLCFFKDEDDFLDQKAAASPLSIFEAKVEKAENYTKRKNVFRVITCDGAEYLFLATSEGLVEEWVSKISFHAHLHPSMQLLSYDTHKDGSQPPAVPDRTEWKTTVTVGQQSNTIEPIYQNRISIVPSYEEPDSAVYQNIPKTENNKVVIEVVPPLPSSSPPPMAVPRMDGHWSRPGGPHGVRVSIPKHQFAPQPPRPPGFPGVRMMYPPRPPHSYPYNRGPPRMPTQYYNSAGMYQEPFDGVPGSRQPISEFCARSLSLPETPMTNNQNERYYDVDNGSRLSTLDRSNESSSENDSNPHSGKEKKKNSVFKFLSRRKGAQV